MEMTHGLAQKIPDTLRKGRNGTDAIGRDRSVSMLDPRAMQI
jgi:hypothetical protein